MKKALSVLLSGVIYTALTILVVTLVITSTDKTLSKMKDNTLIETAKSELSELDEAILKVVSEGTGSQRLFQLEVKDGTFEIVNYTDDKSGEGYLLYKLEDTEADSISPRTKRKIGNLVMGSNLNASSTDDSINDNVAFDSASKTVLMLDFNEGSGTSTDDGSVYNNDGTLGNATASLRPTRNTTECKSGKCLTFDGSNDFVNVTDSDSIDITATALTLEAWIYPDNVSGIHRIIDRTSFAGAAQYGLSLIDNDPSFYVFNGSTQTVSSTSNPISAGAWYHVAGTYDGSNIKVYVNGIELASAPVRGTLTTRTADVYIGSYLGSNYFFDGNIDEVRISNYSRNVDDFTLRSKHLTVDINHTANSTNQLSLNSSELIESIYNEDMDKYLGGKIYIKVDGRDIEDTGYTELIEQADELGKATIRSKNNNSRSDYYTYISLFSGADFLTIYTTAVNQTNANVSITIESPDIASTSLIGGRNYIASINDTSKTLIGLMSTTDAISTSSTSTSITLTQAFADNKIYLIFTQANEDELKSRIKYIKNNEFESLYDANFGYKTKEDNTIEIKLAYSSVRIVNTLKEKLQAGIYQFIVKNEGPSGSYTGVKLIRY